MASITERAGIKKNQVYECIADFNDPFNDKIKYKKGDILIGDDIKNIDETNIQFFKLIGGRGITHIIGKNNKVIKLHRRPVEIGDVFFVKFARIKYKYVAVLDVLEDCQMAAVYPTCLGYLPLGALCREEHKGWIGVNYNFEFNVPEKVNLKSNEDELG